MGVAITGGESVLAGSLAERLTVRGAPAVTIADDTASGIEDALRAASDTLGETPAVVRLGLLPEQVNASLLTTTSVENWQARAEHPLRDAFAFHQAAARFLSGQGGRIIVVLPTVGLSGAPGLTPLATAAEGERSLAKAQARISGAANIRINCIAVTSSLLAQREQELDRGGLPPTAIPVPDLDRLADLINALCGEGFAGVTGQTIALDGGRWMAP